MLRVKAATLVPLLGSPNYHDREAASAALRVIGEPATAVLAAAASDPDPEIRARSQWLLPVIETSTQRARLEAFLADPDPARSHGLVGWDQFRAAAGTDAPAKRLFADLTRDAETRPVLEAAARSPEARQEAADRLSHNVAARAEGADGQPVTPPRPLEVAALLFGQPGNQSQLGLKQFNLSHHLSLTKQNPDWFARGDFTPAHTRLLVHWLEARHAVYDAYILKVDPAVTARLAGRPLRAAGTPIEVRDQALTVLLWLKTNNPPPGAAAKVLAAVPDVVVRFDDDTPLGAFHGPDGQTHPIMLRDAALATALVLTGQKPRDYGMEELGGDPPTTSSFGFAPRSGQDAAARRAAAFEKWRKWTATKP